MRITVSGRRLFEFRPPRFRRDPTRFPHPDRFDIGRRQNGGLGFGHGARSIAAGLARSHTAIAVHALLRAAPKLALDREGDLIWRPIAGAQALQTLDVRAFANSTAARRAARACSRLPVA